MQGENYIKPGSPILPQQRSNKTNLWISIHAIAFFAGVGLLVFLVYKIGFQSIIDSIANVGWGFLIIIGLNLLRHLMRSATMYLAVSPEHRTFKYRSAVFARLGGEAVNFFTFTGPFLGDATKAVLLKRNISLTIGASAVLIDNLLYYVTVILMVLTGVAVLLLNYESGSLMSDVLVGVVAISVVLVACLIAAILYRFTPVTHGIDILKRLGIAPRFLLNKRQNILDVERNVFEFYHERTGDFFTIFFISVLVHAVSVVEVYVALKLLGFEVFFSTAFIIESLTKVINAVFGFIPGTIGAYEGGNGLILRTLGYTTGVGIALALVRRGAILFSTFIGLLILIWRTAESGAKHVIKNRE